MKMSLVERIRNDHAEILSALGQYSSASDKSERMRIAEDVGERLRSHMRFSEAEFYPEVEEHGLGRSAIDLSLEEHAAAQLLLDRLDGNNTDAGRLTARILLLLQHFERHVEREEREILDFAVMATNDPQAGHVQRRAPGPSS